MTNDEGKTQAPSHQTDTRPECMDRVRCTTCGVEREMNVSGRE